MALSPSKIVLKKLPVSQLFISVCIMCVLSDFICFNLELKLVRSTVLLPTVKYSVKIDSGALTDMIACLNPVGINEAENFWAKLNDCIIM